MSTIAIISDLEQTQTAQTRSAAAPAARAARASRQSRRPPAGNPEELELIIGTTVQEIQFAEQNEVPSILQLYAVGQALREGEVELANAETTRKYGSRFISQVAGRCGFHSRKARHALDLVMTFSLAQVAQLAQAALPFRQLREALAFVGDGQEREARKAILLARIPKDGTAAARRSFTKWLDGQHCKRNPLMQTDRFAVVGTNGEIHGRLTTEARARALARGRRVVKVAVLAD